MKFAIPFVLMLPSIAFAQANRELPAELRKGFIEMVEPLRLIRNPKVRKEIDIVPEQEQKLERMYREHRAATVLQAEAADKIEDSDERSRFTRESEAENQAKSMEILREILLESQMKRLDQLVLRAKVEQFGLPVLADEPEIKRLGFSSETFDRLEDAIEAATAERDAAANEARKVYQQALKDAETKYTERVFGVLTPTQRKALDDLLGPPVKGRQDASRD